jgi:hypothetical protein
MTRKTMAIIIAVCKHCQQIMEVATDESSEDGRWHPPRVGGQIGADVITSAKTVKASPLPLLGYVVELDTRIVPHCEAAKAARNTT